MGRRRDITRVIWITSPDSWQTARDLSCRDREIQIVLCNVTLQLVLNYPLVDDKHLYLRRHNFYKMWKYNPEQLYLHLANLVLYHNDGFGRILPTARRHMMGMGKMNPDKTLRRENIEPWWWNDERVHNSHKGALYRNDPEWYARKEFGQFEQLPMFFPPLRPFIPSPVGRGDKPS